MQQQIITRKEQEESILRALRRQLEIFKAEGRTQGELARELGVSESFLCDVLAGHRRVGEKIEAGLLRQPVQPAAPSEEAGASRDGAA